MNSSHSQYMRGLMFLPNSHKIFYSSVQGEGLATGPLRYTSSKNRRPRGHWTQVVHVEFFVGNWRWIPGFGTEEMFRHEGMYWNEDMRTAYNDAPIPYRQLVPHCTRSMIGTLPLWQWVWRIWLPRLLNLGWFSTALLNVMQQYAADIDTKNLASWRRLTGKTPADWGSQPGKINLQECHGFLCRWGDLVSWGSLYCHNDLSCGWMFVVMVCSRRNDWGKHGTQRSQTRRCKLQCRYCRGGLKVFLFCSLKTSFLCDI